MPFSTLPAVNAIEKNVDHYVTAPYAEFGEKSLHALSSQANKNPTYNRLVGRRVLPDDQHPRGTVQPAAMKNRAPFDAKVRLRVNCLVGMFPAESLEGLIAIARIVVMLHKTVPL